MVPQLGGVEHGEGGAIDQEGAAAVPAAFGLGIGRQAAGKVLEDGSLFKAFSEVLPEVSEGGSNPLIPFRASCSVIARLSVEFAS